jgi:hypothetical protein
VSHRTVRCDSGATATSRATVDCNALNARLRAEEQSTRGWHTGQPIGPVWCARRAHKTELQRSEPFDQVTWLAHWTVSGGTPDCPVRHATDSLPTTTFGGWGYKYPQPPHIQGIQVSTLLHLTGAIAFITRHTKEIKSSPNSTQSFSD